MTKAFPLLLSLLCLTTAALLPACDENWTLNRSANYEAGVIRAFVSDPGAAVMRYRDSWSDAPVIADQMVVAAELMEADPTNYERYYRYVRKGLASNDERVVRAATRAMRSSKGESSMELLFDLYASNDPSNSHAAMDSIRYRYVTAMHSPGLRLEASWIEARAAKANLPLE
jgi:hypothetical protein